MAIYNELCQALEKFEGGQQGPSGSFFNPRTMEVFQQGSDGALPLDGTFFLITNSSSSTLSQCATAINTAIGTSYTSASLHTHVSGDVIAYPGIGAQDA